MTKKSGNASLRSANKAKNDEFYTMLTDIEKELKHYTHHFAGKHIFCNCDDPEYSDFFRYFVLNFEKLSLSSLTVTHFEEGGTSYKLEVNSKNIKHIIPMVQNVPIFHDGEIFQHFAIPLKGDGDFRSDEAIEILKQSDIVVTNPPFSLFREYVAQLFEYNKQFIILGNMNAITYKEIFPLIKDNKLWSGYGFNMSLIYRSPYENELKANRQFVSQKGYNPKTHIKVPAINWYTNLDIKKRSEEVVLYKKYKGNEEKYPKYDNYNGIEVSRVADIPMDYEGAMGVPITFLNKYTPSQFTIIKFRKGDDGKDLTIKGKTPYFRILIKNKKPLLL